MVLDEIVKKTLIDKGKDGTNKPYTVNYDVVLEVQLFETTIKLAEAFNISFEEAIMIGVDKMAKSHLDYYVEKDDIREHLESEKENDKNTNYIINKKKSDLKNK